MRPTEATARPSGAPAPRQLRKPLRATALLAATAMTIALPGAADARTAADPASSTTSPAVAAPAAAAAGDFSTSFEQGQPQPAESTVEVGPDGEPRQQNVSGTVTAPGSLLGSVIDVAASAENPPNEPATKLADSDPSTKWLAFEPTAWISYQLDAPAQAVTYTLTSADDAEQRDPKDFVLQGSADGQTWTDLDSRTGQSFDDRFVSNTYEIADPGSYAHYRLNITANQSGGLLQLSGWDLSDGSTGSGELTPMVTGVGSGPISGYNIKPLNGWTGQQAMRFSGGLIDGEQGHAWNRLFDVDIAVGADTRLNYKIIPDMIAGDLSYPSTHTAVDLHFTDGSYLSDSGAVDLHGVPASPSGQGAGKILYAAQWNDVSIDVGKFAAGKTIDRILIGYDNRANTEALTRFGGWLDDLTIVAQPEQVDGSDRTNYVDTRRGTNASGSFSRGNNLPISAVPNGFTFFTPATDANSQSWLYHYQAGNNDDNLPVLQGMNISHEPSPWMGDRNQVSVMPSIADGVPTGNADGRGLAFDHANEVAHPDYYSVELAGGITLETTPADHGGVMRFTFPDDAQTSHLVVDTVDNNGDFTVDAAAGTLTGWVDNGGRNAGRSRMFVYGTFDRPATGTGTAPDSHDGTTYASFDTSTEHQVELKLATSFISLEQAQANHGLELADSDFDGVRAAANDRWSERLGIFDVEGANSEDLRTLYSNLYRLNLYPNSQFENTGTADDPVYSYASPVSPKDGDATPTETNAKIVEGKIYVNNGFWDTYRTVWPAYTLLYPEVAAEIADGFVQQYRDGGWVARWSSPGYADLMTGTSSDVAFADAYVKGIDLPDPLGTYDAALKNATTLSGRSAVGRKGLSTSVFRGYTSSETGESVSWGLEGFINDYGIGNMAAALAKDPATPKDRRAQLVEESRYFLSRATDYVNLFSDDLDFFAGRTAAGDFPTDFDPGDWGGDFTETNAWNFAFHAPQDGNGLANLYGGRDGLADKLDEFFATPETATKPGGYGGVIHEMLEARDVRMGMFGMSNQVSHHIPYMYNYTGQHYKTAEKVREVMQRLYTGSGVGQGYPGDEDNGEMSAWYLLSALGLYPLQVGSPEWVIGSPKFTSATVHRTQGDLVVNAPENSETNIYVQSMKVNGKKHTKSSVDQSDLAGEARIDFAMGAEPSDFGSKPKDAPTSLTTGSKAPKPLQDATGAGLGEASSPDASDVSALFDDDSTTSVAFASATPEIDYRIAGGGHRATWYTLTSGAVEGDPVSWTVQGSKDGQKWKTVDRRTDQEFNWRLQTRPFEIDKAATYSHYRLVIDGANADTVNLAEFELLTDGSGARARGLEVLPADVPSLVQDQEFSGTLATIAGSKRTSPEDISVTLEWGDGATSDGTVTAGRLGTFSVSGSHTYAEPGYYQVRVVAAERAGSAEALIGVTVHNALTPSYASGFDLDCIGEVGTELACDANDAGIPAAGLADAGAAPGQVVTVPGTDLTFSLASIPAGEPDNATGAGQTLPVSLAPGATQLSLIGTGTQRNQQSSATVTFDDGSTVEYPVGYGDWCGGVQGDNILVLKTGYRLRGTGTDSCQVSLFATAPLDIPAGKTVTSITLAEQAGDPRSAGRIHVFAVADNGESVTVAPEPGIPAEPGTELSATLGTISGGVPGEGGYTARVQWGDGTVTEDATISEPDADGTATITGTHTYAEAGGYTVRVLAADSRSDTLVQIPATVAAGAAADRAAADRDVGAEVQPTTTPGDQVAVQGTGFAPGEKVTVKLGSSPVNAGDAGSVSAKSAPAAEKADAAGRVSAELAVPAGAADGLYAVTVQGNTSGAAVIETVTVTAPHAAVARTPQALVGSQSGRQGELFRSDAYSFAPGEWVTVAFDGAEIGEVQANADGVVTDLRLQVPADAKPGKHAITYTGGSSEAVATVPYSVIK